MGKYNPNKSVWYNPNIEYLFNDEIIEYDIENAGLSLIKEFKLLPISKINELSLLDKLECHIAVGKLQREDKIFSKRLSDAFAEMRRIFISSNSIDDNRIISVKKDALYIIGKCTHLEFRYIKFRAKNVYSSYIRFPNISNIEIYYNNDIVDVKGINELHLNMHRLYILEFISKVMGMVEIKDNGVKRVMSNFITKYKEDRLEDGYYLEFNNKSLNDDPVFNYINILVPLTLIIVKEMN